jgi:hypothetical protein
MDYTDEELARTRFQVNFAYDEAPVQPATAAAPGAP